MERILFIGIGNLCFSFGQAISSADTVVVMEKGHVKWVGSSGCLPASLYLTVSPLNEFDKVSSNEGNGTPDTLKKDQQNLPLEKYIVPASEGIQDIIEVEARKEGKVELSVYKNYATFTGWFVSVVIFLSAILMQASRNGNDLWLSHWVDATRFSQEGHSTSFYLVHNYPCHLLGHDLFISLNHMD